MNATRLRLGIIGFGYVGRFLFEEVSANPKWGVDVAFVWPGRKGNTDVPPKALLGNLSEIAGTDADLVVEAAHAEISRDHGPAILAHSDYMPLSLTALADIALEERMTATAIENGHCLYVPHGAAVGLDSLAECRDLWDEVTVTMRKNPRNLDFAAAGELATKEICVETELYDGPTRGACALFPRNVNAHAAVAMAGIGFDRTRSILIADPSLDVSVIELSARGNGVAMHVERSNPLKGVSGVMTLRSILGSVQRAKAPGIHVKVV